VVGLNPALEVQPAGNVPVVGILEPIKAASIITPAPIDYENWDDILIANNTFYNTPKTTPIAFGARKQISKVTAKNIVVKNNLIYNAAKDLVGVAIAVNPAITTDSTTRIDNNLGAGTSPRMSFGGKIYDTGEAFNIGTGNKDAKAVEALKPELAATISMIAEYAAQLDRIINNAANKGKDVGAAKALYTDLTTKISYLQSSMLTLQNAQIDIQEDIQEISEDVEDLGSDVEEIQEDIEELTEENYDGHCWSGCRWDRHRRTSHALRSW
jgi:cell division protein FtsL